MMANEGALQTSGPKTTDPQPIGDFEAGLVELEKIVKEMESSDLSLERSMELFEKGMTLTETCRKQLQEAETRVEMIMKREGKFQPEPFRPSK
jgi:exodeoxyribonuclease VII small subunit